MRYVLTWLFVLLASDAMAGALAQAPGSTRTERFEVYVGLMPAALSSTRVGLDQASGSHRTDARQADSHHVVVALFDRATGQRVTDATVSAHHTPPGGRGTTKRLEPMPFGDTLTYGNTFSIAAGAGHRIEIEIRRDGSIDHAAFRYDNLHGKSP